VRDYHEKIAELDKNINFIKPKKIKYKKYLEELTNLIKIYEKTIEILNKVIIEKKHYIHYLLTHKVNPANHNSIQNQKIIQDLLDEQERLKENHKKELKQNDAVWSDKMHREIKNIKDDLLMRINILQKKNEQLEKEVKRERNR
jgi:hypothetical protein